MSKRRVFVGQVEQGPNERIAYSFDWSNMGTPDAAGSVIIYNDAGTNTSTTNLSGTASLSGNIVTAPLVISLTANGTYQLVSRVVISGNTLEAYVMIKVEAR